MGRLLCAILGQHVFLLRKFAEIEVLLKCNSRAPKNMVRSTIATVPEAHPVPIIPMDGLSSILYHRGSPTWTEVGKAAVEIVA